MSIFHKGDDAKLNVGDSILIRVTIREDKVDYMKIKITNIENDNFQAGKIRFFRENGLSEDGSCEIIAFYKNL